MTRAVDSDAGERLILVLPDGDRVPVDASVTIGRGAASDVRIDDRTVSRRHARITVGPVGVTIEDVGSRFGTRLSGQALTEPVPLRSGAVIGLGDVTIRVQSDLAAAAAPVVERAAPLLVERSRPPVAMQELGPGPGETIVVPPEATISRLRAAADPSDPGAEPRPRVRAGWALKRLGADEGATRFVLQDLRARRFLTMDSDDAALFELIDGSRTISELLLDAESRVGPAGPGRLGRLVAELADRGLLAGVDPAPAAGANPTLVRRLLRPREYSATWPGRYFERAYHGWGRLFFLPLSVTFLALFALAGFATFAYLVGARYGTPFVVARHLVIGGAVFVAGRFALVAAHELAHGLALAHYGRRAARGGLRLMVIFPYAFVDTSEAYFEPRVRRIVVSAAGPASDLTWGAVFSLSCAVSPRGAVRDVFFQLAFGAYVGAFFNLNPFLDRDGYNILVDFLREPRLRRRARRQLAARISGQRAAHDPVLGRYALAGVIWSCVGAMFAVICSNRYFARLDSVLPHGVSVIVFVLFYLLLLAPVLIQLGVPAISRARFGSSEVNRALD